MTSRLLILVAYLLFGGLPSLTVADINLPDMGDAAGTLMSPEEERRLGEEFMRNVRQSLKLLDDPAIDAYIQALGDHLVSQVSDYHQPITFFVVDDPSINAFAGPGGYIGVHTGLITAARTEGELAAVLAHEIAHVVQRHLLRSVETDSHMQLPTLAAILAAIIVGGSNPQVSEAVLASSIAGSTQHQLTYSRQHEQEADRVGLDILARAGYDPRSMVSFFEKLQQANRYGDNRLPEFLLTHPLTFSRIADTRNRAAQYPHIKPGDDTTFRLIQARTAVATEKRDSLVINESASQSPITRYKDALIWQKRGEYARASKAIENLLQQDPNRVLYHQTAAEIALAAGETAKARKILTKSLTYFPDNTPLTLLYADTLLQTGEAATARKVLERQIRLHPGNKRLYALHARAAQKEGRNSLAYQSLAEIQLIEGNRHQAVDYLELALKQPDIDQYQKLAIQARLKTLKEELRQEALLDEQNQGEKTKVTP
jgi:predicted Zn-dependent protease